MEIEVGEESDMVRVVIIGVSHWHLNLFLKPLKGRDDIEFVGVSDSDADIAAKIGSEVGCPSFTSYEDMVDDQEGTIRQVLKFIGAEFDPACLAFHENRRYARTASYAQVTEKLYDSSRYRYRNYLPQPQSAIEILTPTIERLGYKL